MVTFLFGSGVVYVVDNQTKVDFSIDLLVNGCKVYGD